MNKTNNCSSTTVANTKSVINLKISPCKDCNRENKCIGCHGTCNEYILWKDARAERSNQIYNAKIKESVITGYEVSRAIKAKRSNKRY